eukprot:bmy_13636T0
MCSPCCVPGITELMLALKLGTKTPTLKCLHFNDLTLRFICVISVIYAENMEGSNRKNERFPHKTPPPTGSTANIGVGCGVVTVTCVSVTCHQHPPSCFDMSIISLGHRDDLEKEPVTPGGRAGPEEGQPWSSTYRPKGFDVTVKYTQGSWTGFVGEDVVTIPKGFNSSFLVNIATIFESENFFLPGIKWNGILGLAYATLAKPSSSLETFFDSLVAQAKIPNVFSMQMCGAGLPVAGSGTNGGSLVLGGIEPTLYKGDIWYTPIKEEWYYQIEILKLEIGGQSLNLDCREYNADKAIVDSGTTLLRLPQKVFDAVVEAVARTSLIPEFSDGFWTGSQLACWTNSETPWSYFPKISIYLRDENSSRSFRITVLPQLYIQPMMGAGMNYECYRFGISPSTNALVIGATVMEGFYVVFDRARKRVGFAASPCADILVMKSELNTEIAGAPVSEISGPFSTEDIASNCVPALPLNEPILWIVSYTLMSVCGIILLILIILLLLPFRCRHLPPDPEVVNDESSLVRHRWK